MLKSIQDLTEKDAEEILDFMYSHTPELVKNKDYSFTGIQHEKIIDKDGSEQVTFGGRSAIGIHYRAGINNDGFVLPFSNTYSVLWLYKNGYDITELLEENKRLSEMEADLDRILLHLYSLWRSDEQFGRDPDVTLEYVKEVINRLLDKYLYKEYTD